MSLNLDLEKIRSIPDESLEEIITQLKGDILTLVHDAGSGHCGGSLSLIRSFFMYLNFNT